MNTSKHPQTIDNKKKRFFLLYFSLTKLGRSEFNSLFNFSAEILKQTLFDKTQNALDNRVSLLQIKQQILFALK